MKEKDAMTTKGKLSNVWQTLVIIGAIFMLGWTLNGTLNDAVFSEEEVKEIAKEAAVEAVNEYAQGPAIELAKEAAQEVISDHEEKQETEKAEEDSYDFVQGWTEAEGVTMQQYIDHCHNNKTRVYKGGLLMIENEYGTRDKMSEIFGELLVNDLVWELQQYKR